MQRNRIHLFFNEVSPNLKLLNSNNFRIRLMLKTEGMKDSDALENCFINEFDTTETLKMIYCTRSIDAINEKKLLSDLDGLRICDYAIIDLDSIKLALLEERIYLCFLL